MHLKAGRFVNAVYPYGTTKRFLAKLAQDKIRKDKFRKINSTSFSYKYFLRMVFFFEVKEAFEKRKQTLYL